MAHGRVARVAGVQAGGHVLGDLLIEMKTQLILKPPLDLGSAEDGAQTHSQFIGPAHQ
jgi:hypothetical protein